MSGRARIFPFSHPSAQHLVTEPGAVLGLGALNESQGVSVLGGHFLVGHFSAALRCRISGHLAQELEFKVSTKEET